MGKKHQVILEIQCIPNRLSITLE